MRGTSKAIKHRSVKHRVLSQVTLLYPQGPEFKDAWPINIITQEIDGIRTLRVIVSDDTFDAVVVCDHSHGNDSEKTSTVIIQKGKDK